ncbi:flagellar basal body-associated protein FliL [Lysinibacillus sp. SGAir0095]|uniref:flagellar basal body-associated protein FliL n=1 Tax=Lysinibacillus sp. SGAir0095 TaxID=2070463 RepID=UPI0010CD3924|nr:flagellar basal body-associated protein FliL [Lysinibacillus sp. SGAir0095]QCR31804.1 flagellar basal body-associated protein FliL [Lysinibacillus sp. SGAir0095]
MKKNKLLTVMLIILVTITLIGVVIFVLLTQFNKQTTPQEPTIDEIVESSVDVTEITTNLADNSIIMLSLKIQTDSKEAAAELTKRDFQTKNLVLTQLSEMTEEDLKGKDGKTTFESTLKSQLNELMQEGEIKQVYITSYIIQ